MNKNSKTTTNQRPSEIVESLSPRERCCTGHLVADEFIFGEIARVSARAPVLILKHRERTVVPGAGANAIYNTRDARCECATHRRVGDDDRTSAAQSISHKHIPISGIMKLKGRSTVTKGLESSPANAFIAPAGGARGSRPENGFGMRNTTRELILATTQRQGLLTLTGFRLWIRAATPKS